MATRQAEVLEFLRTKNLLKGEKGFQYHLMLWMLKDRSFFAKVLDTLRERLIFSEEVWAYSFHHRDDERACREYLMNSQAY